ncbi:hypothetical protein K443DRAFT_8598 [Laccaria amethystina LaAM-08-1]|uniref:Uncharacterized protein n=1 Tax=Laccaria amethystina LaAM-08-1 TaxID=1095629 RepID=A0A0C9XCB0_9AGAR|nr:hypothetical protein K443DRAFT_8598 [Laccaria amethystina LaAM-08-1]
MDNLERLNANIAFKASAGATYRDRNEEIDAGIKEGRRGRFIRSNARSAFLPTLLPVVNFLRTLGVPSTHPTHPAAQVILTTLKEAQRGYADMRGLEREVPGRAGKAACGFEFGEWVELILGTLDEEFKVLQGLNPLSSAEFAASAFGTLLPSILNSSTQYWRPLRPTTNQPPISNLLP